MAQFFNCILSFLIFLSSLHGFVEGQEVGVNYGMLGNNLPPPDQVIALCKSKNIPRLRLFNPNQEVFKALYNTGIEVVLGTDNMDLNALANDQSFATKWVENNIKPHVPAVKFLCISAGNEVIPGELAAYVLPAMKNLKAALQAANLTNIPVTTVVFSTVLGESFPPSITRFSGDSAPIMVPIVKFLEQNKYPLLCNLYPSFAHATNPKKVRLDYALFNTSDVVVNDGEFEYKNLFDAMLDAVYWALKNAGAPNVDVVVSETGWPSGGGGDMATVLNARTYDNNLIAHVKSGKGTPLMPKKGIEVYIFALFNENLKPDGVEQHWGLFYPNMTEVYPVNFDPSVASAASRDLFWWSKLITLVSLLQFILSK